MRCLHLACTNAQLIKSLMAKLPGLKVNWVRRWGAKYDEPPYTLTTYEIVHVVLFFKDAIDIHCVLIAPNRFIEWWVNIDSTKVPSRQTWIAFKENFYFILRSILFYPTQLDSSPGNLKWKEGRRTDADPLDVGQSLWNGCKISFYNVTTLMLDQNRLTSIAFFSTNVYSNTSRERRTTFPPHFWRNPRLRSVRLIDTKLH